MNSPYQIVDIWLGRFATENALNHYLSESDEIDDEVPRSRFAKDQNQLFVDHDFIEASFHTSTGDISCLLTNHSFVQSYLSASNAAFASSGIENPNVVILVFEGEVQSSQSIETAEYRLSYLGRVDCNPQIALTSAGDGGIPSLVHLLVRESIGLTWNGTTVSSIPVDARGLIIGRESPVSSAPRLDVSTYVDDVATDQLKIYQDQFEQWIIQDLAGNGLTRIDGEDLTLARTFPWHGRVLSIGNLKLEWSVD